MQGLLNSIQPWITGGSPSALDQAFAPYGGTTGLISAMLQDSPGSQGSAAFGRALQTNQDEALNRAGARQHLAQGTLGLQRMQAMMPLLSSIFQQAAGSNGTPAASNASSGNSGTQPPTGGVSGQPRAQGASGGPSAAPVIGPFSAIPQSAPGMPTPGAGANSAHPPVGAPVPAGDPAQQAYQRVLAQYRLGAMLPMLGMNGAGFTKMADFQAANAPALVTRRAVAADQISQDQEQLYQAYASGNPMAVQAARMKYLTDSKLVNPSSWNNSLTLFGGLTPQMLGYSAVNPQSGYQMIGGVASPIPNIIPTRQALAGAQARGAAQGQVERVWDPVSRQWGYVPRSAFLGGNASLPAPTGPGNAAAPPTNAPGAATGGSLVAAPNPQQAAYMRGTGEEGAHQVVSLQDAAQSAQQANFQLAQILKDGQSVVTGPTAGARKWMDTATGYMQQWLGLPVPKSLANYQELDKYANQVAFSASRQLGSREAAQIVKLEQDSNPNKTMVPAAFRDLIGAAHTANDYVIAQNQYVQRVAQRNGGNALYAQANFTSNADPRVWELAISPELAAKWTPEIGIPQVAKVMPYMLPRTALNAFANLTRGQQTEIMKYLPANFAQEMVNAGQ